MAEDETIGVDERALDDDALEALAAIHATPPRPGLRARLLAEARGERAVRRQAVALRRWRATGAIAAGLVLVLGGLLAGERQRASTGAAELADLARTNHELVARLEDQGRTLAGLREALAVQAHVVRVLAGPRTITATLVPTAAGGTASGRVLVDAASGEAAVVLAGLGTVPAGSVYELWAIRGERAPEPAGLLVAGPEGAVAIRANTVPRPADVTAFAVSIEPAGGSTSPTGPIVLAGAVKS